MYKLFIFTYTFVILKYDMLRGLILCFYGFTTFCQIIKFNKNTLTSHVDKFFFIVVIL